MSNTTNSTKVTKRERFAQLMAIVEASNVANATELKEFIEHEVELLNKKNSRSGKPTKTQVENETIKAQIVSILERVRKPMTVTQLLSESELAGLSNQKISALLTQLRESGKVMRTVEKKVAYYSMATENDEEEGE